MNSPPCFDIDSLPESFLFNQSKTDQQWSAFLFGVIAFEGHTPFTAMKIEDMRIGMQVRHVQYGVGAVKSLNEHTADVRFDSGVHTVDPQSSGVEPAEPTAVISPLSIPVGLLIQRTVDEIVDKLGFEKPDAVVEQLGARWHGGKVVMHPADPTLQTKEVPLEVFFHKIVGIRNQLRVLEQKINAHDKLSDGEKVEMQQYITRSYGSLTTFNILFKEKEDQF